MNFFSKKCVFLLLFALAPRLASGAPIVSELETKSSPRVPVKKSRKPVVGSVSKSSIPVRLTWQTIRSQGEGTKLSTSAETFSLDGEIVPVGVDIWRLKISGHDFPVSLNRGHRGAEGVLFIERQDLLKAFGIVLNPAGVPADTETPSKTGIALVLSRNQNRYLETIYRAPDEDLFMVKATVFLQRPL